MDLEGIEMRSHRGSVVKELGRQPRFRLLSRPVENGEIAVIFNSGFGWHPTHGQRIIGERAYFDIIVVSRRTDFKKGAFSLPISGSDKVWRQNGLQLGSSTTLLQWPSH